VRVCPISSNKSNGSRPSRSELVHENGDRHVAQAADLEKIAGRPLDTLGGVQDHHRAVDPDQAAVGIPDEIPVARRVE
jgi:hypothetical protein